MTILVKLAWTLSAFRFLTLKKLSKCCPSAAKKNISIEIFLAVLTKLHSSCLEEYFGKKTKFWKKIWFLLVSEEQKIGIWAKSFQNGWRSLKRPLVCLEECMGRKKLNKNKKTPNFYRTISERFSDFPQDNFIRFFTTAFLESMWTSLAFLKNMNIFTLNWQILEKNYPTKGKIFLS